MTGPTEDVPRLRRSKQQEKDARLLAANDLREVLSSPAGRRFVWRLLNDESLSYTGEAFSTAFKEGTRSLRLQLKLDCQRDAVKEYLLMMREALERVETSAVPKQEPPDEADE